MAAVNSKTVFSLKGKGLKLDTAEDVAPHLVELKANPDVEQVYFGGNTIGIEASKEIAEALKDKKKLKFAGFDDIFTGRLITEIPESIDAILKAIVHHPELRTVDVSENAFGIRTVQPLIDFLEIHTPLEYLYLNNNGLGPHAGEKIGHALKRLAEKKTETPSAPTLKYVACGRNRLERGSMKAWAEMLRAHASHAREVSQPGLKFFDIRQNGIREHGLGELLDGLVESRDLEIIGVQDNTFTSKDTTKFAKVAKSWPVLRELDISDCYFTTKGLVRMASGLRNGGLPSLELLKLQHNEIRPAGLEALLQALVELPKLRRVELNGNYFSDEDVHLEAILSTLESRREAAGKLDEEHDEDWGFGDLDELDDEASEEEDSDEEEEEEEEAEGKKEEAEEKEKEKELEEKKLEEKKLEEKKLEEEKQKKQAEEKQKEAEEKKKEAEEKKKEEEKAKKAEVSVPKKKVEEQKKAELESRVRPPVVNTGKVKELTDLFNRTGL